MLIELHPTYTLQVTIKDKPPTPLVGQGNLGAVMQAGPRHKYYDGVAGTTGCDAVLAAVREALGKAGITAEVRFDKFEHRG